MTFEHISSGFNSGSYLGVLFSVGIFKVFFQAILCSQTHYFEINECSSENTKQPETKVSFTGNDFGFPSLNEGCVHI